MDWHADYSADHPREADNRVTVLASALSWAAGNRRGIKVNVLAGFERAYKNSRANFIWLPEHVEAFMRVASPEMRLALILALHTGQRQGDLLKLTWDRYDGSKFWLRQGKAARQGAQAPLISIPCSKALKETLDSIKRGRSPLILSTTTGRPFAKRYFSKQWKETCQKAGITDLHFHDLRGTTVTLLFQAGCNLGEIVSITGHSLKRAHTDSGQVPCPYQHHGDERHCQI
ncbi:tyrosine-type recombinase/integrase [Castellaniella sp.]|uniref:tyrosine-type recombinase/integrase n=1 Tax=Castellaniella sp. TaxID=1955812 RepID=UPI002AFE13BE|nr:tyrosine-type recombinase/integrase [Castellaniella sp.]